VDYGYSEFDGSIDTVSYSLDSPMALFRTSPGDNTLGTMDATLTGKLDWFGLRERYTFE
jgi:hypothetical protein